MAKAKKPKDRIEVVTEGRKGWNFVVYLNGKAMVASTESYRRESSAVRGAERFQDAMFAAGEAPIIVV
jgi:hypothetical protein